MGFIDISEKPTTLTKKEHKKLINIQDSLKYMADKLDYLREVDPIEYIKWQELSAEYQLIVLQHYEV